VRQAGRRDAGLLHPGTELQRDHFLHGARLEGLAFAKIVEQRLERWSDVLVHRDAPFCRTRASATTEGGVFCVFF
jgi:hypothetical protein